jgi:glycosyltransferase involved in cell wall biosynthesis
VNRVFDLQKRCTTRELLGFSKENKIICYCGGLAPWQRIETILDLAVRIANMDNNIRFLFLTRKSQDMARLIAEAHLDSSLVRVVSCGQAETPTYLSATDIGIILRHDNIINNVASPIKIGEYLASGIPVLLTRGIGDYSELVPSHNVGIICEPEERDIEDIVLYINKLDPQELFSRCTEFANRYLRWQAYSGQFERTYR